MKNLLFFEIYCFVCMYEVILTCKHFGLSVLFEKKVNNAVNVQN